MMNLELFILIFFLLVVPCHANTFHFPIGVPTGQHETNNALLDDSIMDPELAARELFEDLVSWEQSVERAIQDQVQIMFPQQTHRPTVLTKAGQAIQCAIREQVQRFYPNKMKRPLARIQQVVQQEVQTLFPGTMEHPLQRVQQVVQHQVQMFYPSDCHSSLPKAIMTNLQNEVDVMFPRGRRQVDSTNHQDSPMVQRVNRVQEVYLKRNKIVQENPFCFSGI